MNSTASFVIPYNDLSPCKRKSSLMPWLLTPVTATAGSKTKRVCRFVEWQAVQCDERINPTRGNENEVGAGTPGQFQAVETSVQVGIHQVIRRASIAACAEGSVSTRD